MNNRRALIVMAKEPAAGRTKTRLSPPLTPGQAADLYRCLLLDTLDTVRETAQKLPLARYIAFSPANSGGFFRELAPDFGLLAQQGETLGERLATVLLAARAEGYEQAAAINSDGPGLPSAYLVQAFEELDDPAVDVTLGPCDDGGYYLIGWKRPYPQLVREVEMSTANVLADTVALARRDGLRTALLPAWYDVDTTADLARLRKQGQGGRHTREFLSK